ncbi:HU domain-containing protein [Saccharicrinis sp. GN24d3]|uniref:HU domain-containing protein n=1 Tax=Saccharicrinis sp. GN24d3 TaxID=3458416 RepID=UPI0040372FFC
MLHLEKHINDLLYLYDCVIVPGLGGFVANKQNAVLNEKTGVFSPPCRKIGFNKSLSHNDGLLIKHIANAEGISYEECYNKLTKHISILKFQLGKGESIEIGSAGELKNDAMGNTLFIPSQEESFSTDSFGLTTFHFNTLAQLKEQKEPTRRLVRRTLNAKSTRQIAASAALIIGFLLVTPDFGNQTQQSNFTGMFPKMEQTTIVENVEVAEKREVTNEEITNPIEAEPVTIAETAPVTVKNRYFIIAGSFKVEQPARVFLGKLKHKGIQNAEIISSNGRFRVSLEGFMDKQTAIDALNNYRETNGYRSAWLLSQK